MLGRFVLEQINDYTEKLEQQLDGDIIYYYGPTHQLLIKPFRDLIEKMASNHNTTNLVPWSHRRSEPVSELPGKLLEASSRSPG